jgi:hypothetical protein
MNRLVYISFDELRIDHDACAAMLNGAASRSPRMYVSGLASDDRGVVVSMEETPLSGSITLLWRRVLKSRNSWLSFPPVIMLVFRCLAGL